MMLLLEQGKPGMAANICTGKAYKISDILNMLIDISGLKVDVIEDKSLLRASDEPLLLGDNNKITELGFKPSYTIYETLRGVYEDWLNRV
jgi:GDP-4-dehydro-6-deoxy-D-mannose reductase